MTGKNPWDGEVFNDFSQSFEIHGNFIAGNKVESGEKSKRVDYSSADDFTVEFDIDTGAQSEQTENKRTVNFKNGGTYNKGANRRDVVIDGDFVAGDNFDFINFNF